MSSEDETCSSNYGFRWTEHGIDQRDRSRCRTGWIDISRTCCRSEPGKFVRSILWLSVAIEFDKKKRKISASGLENVTNRFRFVEKETRRRKVHDSPCGRSWIPTVRLFANRSDDLLLGVPLQVTSTYGPGTKMHVKLNYQRTQIFCTKQSVCRLEFFMIFCGYS